MDHTEPSHSNHVQNKDSADTEVLIRDSGQQHFKYYSLPTLRYVNIARFVLFVDGISSIVLWLTGGHSKYFVDNIVHFHFRESVFDLALWASLKVILLYALYWKMESTAMAQLDRPYCPSLHKQQRTVHICCIGLSFLGLAFTTTKGGLILDAILNNQNYEKMHLSYNIFAISSVVFSLLEFVISLWSYKAMRTLKVMRILHQVDESGRELDENGEPKKQGANLIRLAKLVIPELGMICVAIVCLLGSSAASTAAPLFFGRVVDAAQKSMEDLNRTVLILLGVYCGGSVCATFRAWLFTLCGQRLVARLRKNLFGSIIMQEVAFFDTNRTGELTNRLSSDTQVVQNAVTVNLSMLARYLLQIIGSLAFMFILNPSLTGVLLAVVPIVSLGAVQYGKLVKNLRQRFQDRLADASTTAEECISSIRTVRSFIGEKKAKRQYGSDIDKSYKVGKLMALAQGSFEGVIGVVSYGAILLVLWYGGKLVFEKQVTAGILTSFLLYTLQVAMAFAFISSLYGEFMQAVGASIRIFDLLDREPKVPNEGGKTLSRVEGGITFKDVQFTYPSRPDNVVLKGVSFTVMPGQMVALVGPSGGGKSTIVNLIERFYDPDMGRIYLGTDDIKMLDPQWFRQEISMVGQEPTLFACSIKENIAYGKESSMEEIIEAAKQANAHDFIETFEEGYETLVGERGVRLSGGQKQRVAIARALIMNPTILLLDEATSALDAESEHLVQEAIDRAMVNRTVLVIAHRLSTVRNASKVIVIDKGHIAEQGSHDELIALDGVYKKLVLRQLTAGSTDLHVEVDVHNPQDAPVTDANDPD